MMTKSTSVDHGYESCDHCFVKFIYYTNSIVLVESDLIFDEVYRLSDDSKMYSLSSKNKVASKDLRCHLDYMLEKLMYSSGGLIDQLKRGEIKGYIKSYWHSYGHQGPVLWPDQMYLLADLKLDSYFCFFLEESIVGSIDKATIGFQKDSDYHVDLLIYPEKIHPDKITKILNLQPTTKTVKGDKVLTKRGGYRITPYSGWFLSSELQVKSNILSDHLNYLLDSLESAKNGFEKLQSEEVSITLKCIWYTGKTNTMNKISAQQMRRMADLDLECALDVYFDCIW